MSGLHEHLPRDTDCGYFLRVLSQTSVGNRYLKALLVMKVLVLEIKILRGAIARGRISKAEADYRIADRQAMYARYSRRASMALDELNLLYDWPSESKVQRSFIWEPPPAAR